MTPDLARLVLQARAEAPKRLTGEHARQILARYFGALGYPLDRWGNYHTPQGERYDLGKTVLRRQYKSGSDWKNLTSTPLQEAVLNILDAAAKALGDDTVKSAVFNAREDRKGAVRKRRSAKEEREAKDQGRVVAWKRAAFTYRADVLASLSGQRLPDDVAAAMNAQMVADADLLGLLASGGSPLPPDSEFASADVPPVLPFFRAGFDAQWTETVGGVPYTVLVQHGAEKHRADVLIGASQMLWFTQQFGRMGSLLSVTGRHRTRMTGDGSITGYVLLDPQTQRFGAALVLITAKTPRAGAGARLLALWCRILKGYGVTRWAAIAVGEEGRAFFARMAARGVVRILGARGADLVLETL